MSENPVARHVGQVGLGPKSILKTGNAITALTASAVANMPKPVDNGASHRPPPKPGDRQYVFKDNAQPHIHGWNHFSLVDANAEAHASKPANKTCLSDTRNLTQRHDSSVIKPAQKEQLQRGKENLKTLPVRMEVRVNDTKTTPSKSLLDSGANLSLMSLQEFKKHFPTQSLNKDQAIWISGLGDKKSLGTVVTTVFIETSQNEFAEVDVEFWVVDSFGPAMCIGLDVMEAYNIDVLISEKRGHFKDINRKFHIEFEKLKPQNHWAVRLSSPSVIQPRSFKVLPISMNSPYKSTDHFFDPGISLSTAASAFGMCSKSVLSGDAKHIVYSNFGDAPIRLEQGHILGHATPLRAGDSFKETPDVLYLSSESETCASAKPSSNEASSVPELNVDPTIAIVPDTQDRHPEPHQSSPTYKVFDVALNDDGVPHPEICKVLDDNIEAFSLDGAPGMISDGTKMKLKTKDDELSPEPMRRVGPEKIKVMKDTIDQLLKWDVIEPSESRISYPVPLVKQNGKWRFCIDYRRLNDSTEGDSYPMQRIDAVFDQLAGMMYFSLLDAIRGYHQIPIDEADRWKTAFICVEGLFQYKRMPFGLKTAPAIFQRLMDKIMGALRGRTALAYIDDCLIYTKTLIEHCRSLDTLLKASIKAGLKFSPAKCHFGYKNIKLLGRVVGREGLQVDQHKAQAVLDCKVPTNMEELYHAIGLFTTYRVFIYNFAKISAPLTSLTKGNKFQNPDGSLSSEWRSKPIQWSNEQQSAFDELKRIIANPPVLAFFDPSLECILYVDASKKAYAFAIHQRFPTNSCSTYTLVSSSLNPVKTDSIDDWISSIKSDHLFGPIYENIQSNKNYRISATKMLLAITPKGDLVCVPKTKVQDVCHDSHDVVGHPGFTKSWALASKMYFRPKLYGALKAYIANCPTCLRNKTSRVSRPGELPPLDIEPIAFHEIAMDFTTGLPTDRGFDTILLIVDKWTKCVILIPTTKDYTAQSVADLFFDNVIKRSFFPCKFVSDRDKIFIGHFWTALVKKMGVKCKFTSPYHAQSDYAERYNQTLETMLRAYTTDIDNWSKALVWCEIAMNSLKNEATGYSPFELLYNNATGPFEVTSNAIAREGREVDAVEDIFTIAEERIREAKQALSKAHESVKHYYDKKHSKIVPYKVGDWAFIRMDLRPLRSIDQSKLTSPKLGPFRIIQAHSRSVKLELPSNMKVHPEFSIQHLEKSPTPGSDPFNRDLRPPPIEVVEGTEVYEVERLTAKRLFGPSKYVQYKVKWKNYPESESTWLFADDLIEDGLQDLINEFEHASRPQQVQSDLSPESTDTISNPTRRSSRIARTREAMPLVHNLTRSPSKHKFGLLQDNYVERPICFESRVTRTYERGYESLELELSCLTWAILKSLKYVEGNHFTVITDHQNLNSVLRGRSETLYSRSVEKFRVLLSPYLSQMTIVHKAGKDHKNVDALSRLLDDRDA